MRRLLGRLLGRRGVQAGLLFAVLLAAYLANGDILPGQDATANVRLAGKIVAKRSLIFRPETEPYMFEWRLKTEAAEKIASFRSWSSQYNGEPIIKAYWRGDLSKPSPMYYLMATRFPGVYVDKYGLGAAAFAVPFVAAVYPFARDVYDRPAPDLLWHTAKVAAAASVAGSAVFIFLAALAFVGPWTAAGLALAYGLGTCVWSSSSQTLWQHGPTELFLALGTLLLLRQNRLRHAPFVGAAYMMAFACRPTAAVMVAAAAVDYLVRERRALLGFAAGCLPVAILLAVYNLHFFGRLVVLGQLGGSVVSALLPIGTAYAGPTLMTTSRQFGTSVVTGLTGVLLSPSRGLLVFSPALAFALWGMVRVWRDSAFAALRPVSIAAAAMCLVAARWYGWWGGWCYGYRLLVDSVTLLAFCAIPVLEAIRQRRWLVWTCAACLAWGTTVQVVGAFAYDVVGWNHRQMIQVDLPGREPRFFTDMADARREAWAGHGSVAEALVDVNSSRGSRRLWSISDSQILYYLEHFLEARTTKRKVLADFLGGRG